MKFWDNVNTLIKAQGTTQEWVAEHCGINPSAFRSSVSKGNEPGVLRAIRIARSLNTSVEYLVTGLEPPASGPADSTAQEYSQVVSDLKIIDSNIRAGFVSAIHYAAEETRRGKNRQGGSAAG
jgi:hypothetical protein